MITEAIVRLIAAMFEGLGGLFGLITVPGWFNSIGTNLASLASYANGYGGILPIHSAVQALTFWGTCVGLAFVIKVVRIVASFFTAGGGSAS